MAENEGGGGSNALAGVVIGVLLVAMVGLGFYAVNGGNFSNQPEISVNLPEADAPG
jgi:hypothetical protein